LELKDTLGWIGSHAVMGDVSSLLESQEDEDSSRRTGEDICDCDKDKDYKGIKADGAYTGIKGSKVQRLKVSKVQRTKDQRSQGTRKNMQAQETRS